MRDAPATGPDAAEPARSPSATAGSRPAGRQPGEAAVPVIEGPSQPPGEIDGPKGPEPTRFGDWEKDGRCTDF